VQINMTSAALPMQSSLVKQLGQQWYDITESMVKY